MVQKIINRKVITINQNLATRTWETPINLSFQPDQMIVKALVCNGNAGAPINNITTLYCPTIRETLGAFYNNDCLAYPNVVFDSVNYPVNTQWRFELRNVDGALNTTFDGHLSIQLEFIKLQ
jgi:hypothetical protein